MMTLYGTPGTRSLRAAWALEEVGAQYDYVKVDLRAGEGRRPPFSDLNFIGKVPVLIHADVVIAESAAIVNYVGRRFPEARLLADDSPALHAAYDRWAFFIMTELEEPLWTRAKHSFALPKPYRHAAVLPTAEYEYKRMVDVMAKDLGDNDYLVDQRFTGVDILAGHTLSWGKNAYGDYAQGNIRRYLDRIISRPALQRAGDKENSVETLSD
jgi:glutathione S-transferase